MHPPVNPHVISTAESLPANIANDRFFTRMSPPVDFQRFLTGNRFPAKIAQVFPRPRVPLQMLRQQLGKRKRFRTQGTFMIFVAAEQFRMHPFFVGSQMGFRHVVLTAKLALIGSVTGVGIFMNVELDFAEETFAADVATH